MKNKLAKIFIILLPTVLSVSSCTDLRVALGKEKAVPDEFSIGLTSSLVVPPGYGIDPEMIISNKKNNINQNISLNKTLNIKDQKNKKSPNSFIKLFESENVPKDIRKIVEEENIGIGISEQTGIQQLFGTIPEIGVVLDTKKEALRIRNNKLSGKPINEEASPAIEKSSGKSMLIK
jgi:hypothetical protein